MPTMETVINPKDETIEIIKYDFFNGDYTDYLKIIEAHTLTFVRLYENGDGVFLDDEGLYAETQYFWAHKNYPMPLCNSGVFVGINEEGDTVPPKTSFKTFSKDVVFIGSRYQLSLYLRVNHENIVTDEDGYDIDYRPIFFNQDKNGDYYVHT